MDWTRFAGCLDKVTITRLLWLYSVLTIRPREMVGFHFHLSSVANCSCFSAPSLLLHHPKTWCSTYEPEKRTSALQTIRETFWKFSANQVLNIPRWMVVSDGRSCTISFPSICHYLRLLGCCYTFIRRRQMPKQPPLGSGRTANYYCFQKFCIICGSLDGDWRWRLAKQNKAIILVYPPDAVSGSQTFFSSWFTSSITFRFKLEMAEQKIYLLFDLWNYGLLEFRPQWPSCYNSISRSHLATESQLHQTRSNPQKLT